MKMVMIIKTVQNKIKLVLISLISDTFSIRGPYIKLIFGTLRGYRGLLCPLHASI